METMQLTLTPEAMQAISGQLKDNVGLAKPIAHQLLETVDKMVMANFLLADGIAFELLVNKLMEYPEETLKAITKFTNGASRPKKGSGSRPRMTEDELDKLQNSVFAFIKKNPDCMRKDIESAITFSSYSIYKKVINNLKEQKLIKQNGEKANTTYIAK